MVISKRLWWPTQWMLWTLPQRLLTPVLVVEATAVVLGVLALLAQRGSTVLQYLPALLLLCGLAVLHTEIARKIEQVRWRIVGELHVDLSSTWIFAAALALPGGLAALVAVLVDTYKWLRSSGPRTPTYRHVFSTATLVLAALAAAEVGRAVGGSVTVTSDLTSQASLPVVVLALLVFMTVNTMLVAGAIALNSPPSALADVVGEWDENVMEVATYCLGALAAMALVIHPFLPLLALPPLLVLHRAVLVRHLQEKASTDGKTGLLNAAAWHTQAEKELRRARKRDAPRGVLVVDLDHFKQVNDRHGHLAGDHVLAAVAQALRTEVRDRDLVGRFGGEEFVVLLASGPTGDDGTAELTAVAERIRLRIAGLYVEMPTPDGPLTVTGLSASVGAAFFPEHGTELRELLQVADTALYAAKRAGRNAVRAGVPAPRPAPVDQAETR